MDYDYRQKKFLVHTRTLERLGHQMVYAIRNIREASKLPLKGFNHDGLMKAPHYAEAAILEMAQMLGIVLGTSRHVGLPLSYGELDVSQQD